MSEKQDILKEYFPILSDPAFLDDFEEVAEFKTINDGESIVKIGNTIQQIPLLYEGLIKVFREDDEGNELFLYYIYPGQACAISFVCSVKERISQVRAEAVDNCKFFSVPIDNMNIWMQKHKCWYYFVLDTYQSRLEEVLKALDSVAFKKMDERLLEYLKKNAKAQDNPVLTLTHQEIAYELNSSREVISRLLKKMEQLGLIKMGRNSIELINV